ncbi:MAG: tryptophan-rich sensory protein [Rhodoglobus sp.]|uniref:tryptophan-rich sensory protein n=1 Tax=Salinibacterium sp. G-O1 TaxID=3046208 RepID=UPI0024BA3E47|nr:tryptophan-rich sensory protein [Salinibacterium sp. G-O1]MDJ0333844.1 tryptophan-rich sensory protein [Salinibacterium sp. G-O1]
MRETRDIVRQVTVGASAVIAVVGSFIGSGAAGGTPIQDAAGGALSATSTPIAPDSPAFSIWSVIYLGLIAYAVWQFLPKQSSAERHRRLGYWVAASLILNAAWILSVQFDLLPLSLPIIAALLGVLGWAFVLCLKFRPSGAIDALVTDGTIGLYLGWVSIATAANAAAVFTAAGFEGFGLSPDVWAVVVLAVASAVGIMLAIIGHGRIAPALSLSWGIAWVAVGRLTGELMSTPAGIAAIVATALIIVVTAIIRLVSSRPLHSSAVHPGATAS